jgi:UBX domain-containing protein 1
MNSNMPTNSPPPPPQQQQQQQATRFTGTGYTLGSDSQPSQPILSQPAQGRSGPVRRLLTLWRNGFTIDNGALYAFNDPESVEILREIRMGRVPRHVAGAEVGEDVEMKVEKRETEDWTPPKTPKRTFMGHGNRLGRYITKWKGLMVAQFLVNRVSLHRLRSLRQLQRKQNLLK